MKGPLEKVKPPVTVYGVRSALLEGDPLGDVADLFIRREDADRFLADCLEDEPGSGRTVLSVVEVELETAAG